MLAPLPPSPPSLTRPAASPRAPQLHPRNGGLASAAIPLLLIPCAWVFALLPIHAQETGTPDTAWPTVTREARPWTRWWWLGSAVDTTNLTRQLTTFREAGLGGVEICPIYGAKGAESRFLPFLSPGWMARLAHTTTEAERLDLGVDLTTGTGWPFGGPQVIPDDASARMNLQHHTVAAGRPLAVTLPRGLPVAIRAFPPSPAHPPLDLTDRARDGRLEWTAPGLPDSDSDAPWRIYVLARQQPVQQVKRAAPGGAGNVVDPYSVPALERYLAPFDRALETFTAPKPRAQFHDSFEYFAATWTPDLPAEFRRRRGYDLLDHLPALAGDRAPSAGPADLATRVRSDYAETLQDLHREYLEHWTAWSHRHGSLTRNQGHGGPGNLLDFYAAADIPETEIFREVDESQLSMLQFASSAAHLTGRRLASSESFTWLGEHFQVTLADAREAADLLFLGGINHLFFHGIPYSPDDVPWPGWLFYASTHLGPHGGLWHDLPAFNAYLARVQSVLQSGSPDNDLLLYWPQHDAWARKDPRSVMFTVHDQTNWLVRTPCHQAAENLRQAGASVDFVSDRLLAGVRVDHGRLVAAGNRWRAILLADVERLPVETWERLLQLARDGATVLVRGPLPADVPGLSDLSQRRARLAQLTASLGSPRSSPDGTARFAAGSGRLIRHPSDDVALASAAGVRMESMNRQGLRHLRRTHPAGHHYFVVNRSERLVETWVELAVPLRSAVLLDPRFPDRTGVVALRNGPTGPQIRLRLEASESVVIRTFADRAAVGTPWRDLAPAGPGGELTGPWRVAFVEGGPVLPAAFETTDLRSWTDRDDPEARRFAGTARYTLAFEAPGEVASGTPGRPGWGLDLGRVAESARVRLNGVDLGTVFAPPFRVPLGASLRPGRNLLELEVTNLAANRIADLDRRGVTWKAFHEINFVNRDYQPFDASHWPPRPSGLLGPVRLLPLATPPP